MGMAAARSIARPTREKTGRPANEMGIRNCGRLTVRANFLLSQAMRLNAALKPSARRRSPSCARRDAEQEYYFRREADVDTLTCNCQLESV